MSREIIGVIPAAGRGSRLAPYPGSKELFPIGYQDYDVDGQTQKRPKAVSQYLIENMISAGIKRLFCIIGDGKWDIPKYYGDGSRFGVTISYLYQEKLAGMPQAINLIRPWINDEDIMFGMPDTIIEPKNVFQRLNAFHQETSADLTLGLFETSTPQKFGMVELDSEKNVVSTIDKPATTDLTSMWGCACWSRKFGDLLNEFVTGKEFQNEVVLGDVFNEAISRNFNIKGLEVDGGQYIDIGTSDELDSALKKFHL